MNKKSIYPGMLLAFLFVLLVCRSFPVFAVEPIKFLGSYQHQVWTNDNGLPMNTVMSITQTPDGYLWLGTEAGLVRFDGIKFEVFGHENGPGFSAAILNALMTDYKGTLWIVSQISGVTCLRDDKFEVAAKVSHLLSKEFWCILECSDHSIWVGANTGICRLSGGNATMVPLPEYIPTRTVRALLEDRNGRIWVGTQGGGLVLIQKNANEYESQPFSLRGMEITTLFEDRRGALWIGTQENGLIRYWEEQYLTFTTGEGLSSNSISCLYEDRFGNLWIGTNGGGICILPSDFERNRGNKPVMIFPKPKEFTNDFIFSFYEDHEGTLWIGTNGGGLYNLREAKITTYTTENGLSHNNIYGIFQDTRGRVWAGTKGYGVNYFDSREQRFYTLTSRDGLSSDSVVTFAEDAAGSLWFGTLGGGLNRFTRGRIEVFDQRQGLDTTNFRAIYSDPDGGIWAGTIKGEIHTLRDERFTLVANVGFRVNTLYKDQGGFLWAGTFGNGLCRVNLKDGTMAVFDEKKGLSNNIVTCIFEDAKGSLLLGTAKGINRFRAGKFAVLSQDQGLPDDTIYWLLEDQRRDIWASSNKGIFCLSRKEIDDFFQGNLPKVNPLVFGKEDGMRSIECNGGNHPAGWKTRDGKLWFPTTFGVAVVDPANIGVNKIPPPVVIEKIVVDGKTYAGNRPVSVTAGKNYSEFYFTAPSFIVPGKILFKYKLEGYDKKWSEPAPDRVIGYRDLPAGDYRFQVTACNSDGVWNNTGASGSLYLKLRLVQTPVFKVSLLSVIFLFVWLSYRFVKKWHLRHKSIHKTQLSTMSPEETRAYVQKLSYLLEVEKVYKNSNLSIKSLAAKLVISPRNLSNLINNHFKTNFFEFINEYRIKEAQRLLLSPETRDQSILDIAYEVGYNSKSAFNRSFKNLTQSTPSQFKKKNSP